MVLLYTGFNFKTKRTFDAYLASGKSLYASMKQSVEKQLDTYIGENGEINGSELQNDWFPEIKADIFLSHSHKDINLAIGFAGWLKENFGLTTFIDYCVWGYSEELLKKIDKKYCYNENTKTYDYNTRNFSTSHIHMMLSTSLMKMMDKTECIIFLNTSNSTTSTTTESLLTNESTQKTYSPWIYSEIIETYLIKRNPLVPKSRENKFIKKEFSSIIDKKNLNISYKIDTELTHLYTLTDETLDIWREQSILYRNKKTDALDDLYLLTIHR